MKRILKGSFFKTMLLMAFLATLFTACNTKGGEKEQQAVEQQGEAVEAANLAGVVEVLVLHGVKQCETCKAIKKYTEEVVNDGFPEEAKAGKVVFKIIDFSIPENKAIAERYEVAWTSLVVVKHKESGDEEFVNMGAFAIENARENTAVYKQTLKDQIATYLN